MNKRILSLVLALVMVLGTFGTAFAAESTPTGNEKVDKLIDLGLVLGYGDGTYGLTQAITRAEVATMVVRALGLDEVAKASAAFPSQFTDMNSANVLWARGYVNVAAGQGIVNGYPEGNFLPAGNVTYAETAAMLVRAAGGLTEAEEATAVWPTTYLAKAAQLGIFDGVEGIVDYNAPALREKLFEMVYNAVIKLQVGNYQIVKAIVLENYRVEKLAKDEVVVEVIKEVQRANWVAENRDDMRGDQLNLTIPAKLGDVENLLGKVADFTLDKAGNVIAIEIDGTYKTEILTEVAEKDVTRRKFDSYTVELSERIDQQDDRLYRTYFNNDDFTYEDFERKVDGVEYAKVTTKNGKVVFIDAFNFDDIAPVKEVKKDGETVVVYNDLREGTTKNITVKTSHDVLFVEDGNVSVGAREDIKALDVIHEYDGGFIVRTDADVAGTYDKVRSNRDNEYFVVVEGEDYMIGTQKGKQAVYVYDEDEFYTLDNVRTAGSDLKEFEDEDVTILLDLTEKLQYIGAEVEMGEFVGIVTRVIGDRFRVLKSDNKEYNYQADLDTDVLYYSEEDGNWKSSGHQRLNNIEIGQLIYVSLDGETVEEVRVIGYWDFDQDEENIVGMITALTARLATIKYFDSEDVESFAVLPETLYFISNNPDGEFKAITAKEARDAIKENGSAPAYIIPGNIAKDLYGNRAPMTKDTEAYVIVFFDLDLDEDTETEFAQFVEWKNSKNSMLVELADGTQETLSVKDLKAADYVGIAKDKLNSDDVIEVEYDDEDKVAVKVTLRIANNRDNVYEVTSSSKNYITIKDANGKSVKDLNVSDADIFGGELSDDVIRVKVYAKDGLKDNGFLDAILVVSDKWAVTANKESEYKAADEGLLVAAYKDGSKVFITVVEEDANEDFVGVTREYVGIQSLDTLADYINEEVVITLLPGTNKVQKVDKVAAPEAPVATPEEELLAYVVATIGTEEFEFADLEVYIVTVLGGGYTAGRTANAGQVATSKITKDGVEVEVDFEWRAGEGADAGKYFAKIVEK